MSACINGINLFAKCSIRRVSGIFWLIPSFLYQAKSRMMNSIFISKIQFCMKCERMKVWASLYKDMEASLKKQLIEVFRIEDSHHVARLIRIMIHLERLRETTRHTINMNRPPIFSLSKNQKLVQVEFDFCHFITTLMTWWRQLKSISENRP